MKRMLLAGFGLIAIVNVAICQISLQEADEVVQNKFPQYTLIYTFNSPTMFQNPNTGQYTLIYTVGAGHHPDSIHTLLAAVTDRFNVLPEQQNIVDADPKRHLWTYDRSEYQNIQQFSDSLDVFLSKHFTISDISECNIPKESIKIFPNPVEKNTMLKANIEPFKEYTLSIYDVSGRFIKKIQGISDIGGVNVSLGFSSYSNGVYIVEFQSETTRFCTKILKK